MRRKDGTGATGVLHLWHAEADRSRLAMNEKRLDAVVNGMRVKAEQGMLGAYFGAVGEGGEPNARRDGRSPAGGQKLSRINHETAADALPVVAAAGGSIRRQRAMSAGGTGSRPGPRPRPARATKTRSRRASAAAGPRRCRFRPRPADAEARSGWR